jgi:regulator of protease activity HflC (stomatin/prohibitin superfamily)
MNTNLAKTVVGGAVAVVVGLPLLFGSWYTIDQGERGVVTRNGAVVGTAEPGLGFKVPLIDTVHEISTQTHAQMYKDVMAYSMDQQVATLALSVNYKIKPGKVQDVYANYGNQENVVARILDRRVMDEVKTVFGKFNAINAIQDRTRLVAELNAAVKASMLSADGVLEVETVQLENIDFSDVYEQAVEARMKAEVEVAKLRQNLEQERINAEITVTQANAKADSNLALAQSEAKAITVKGNAEADAINAKGKALRDNPALVALVSAEKWDGVLPTTMVPGNAVPFVNVN